ncbi:MAG: hypothetical protein K9L17_01430 [Clostridiales bacterium]|nr:hypothetical protein [Clostridiales bacterium]MCF8021353.1 hypothetical protein [Clostridiales bacterium]
MVNPKSYVILAREESPALGVKKGVVVDADACASVIKKLVDKIEDKFDRSNASTCAGISGVGARVINYTSCITCRYADKFKHSDIINLKKQAYENAVSKDFSVVHIFPVQYFVDGHAVDCAEKRTGLELRADLRLIIYPVSTKESTIESFCIAGLDIPVLAFVPMAQSASLLSWAELEFGCVLLDLGAETITVTAFKYGLLLDSIVLPLGMQHMVSDLAVGLHISMSYAFEILYSVSLYGETTLKGSSNLQLDSSRVSAIINARLEEICELVKQTIIYMNLNNFIPGGIKLTGRGSLLQGIDVFISNHVNAELNCTIQKSNSCSSTEKLAGYFVNCLHTQSCFF